MRPFFFAYMVTLTIIYTFVYNGGMAISVKALKKAIDDYGGNITRIAESFDVNRSAIYNRLDKNDTLKKALVKARDKRNESVVDTLYETAVDDRNITALIYITKAQLGWKETQGVEHSGEINGRITTIDYGLDDKDAD